MDPGCSCVHERGKGDRERGKLRMNNWLFKMNAFATVEDRLFSVLSAFLASSGHVKTFPYNSHLPAGLVQGSVALSGVSSILRALPPPRDRSCLDI